MKMSSIRDVAQAEHRGEFTKSTWTSDYSLDESVESLLTLIFEICYKGRALWGSGLGTLPETRFL